MLLVVVIKQLVGDCNPDASGCLSLSSSLETAILMLLVGAIKQLV